MARIWRLSRIKLSPNWSLVLSLVFALGIFASGYHERDKQHRLEADGVIVEAEILRYIKESRWRGTDRFHAEVSFALADGGTWQSFLRVSHSFLEAHPTGSLVRLRYLPSNPETNVIVGLRKSSASRLLLFVGPLLALLSLILWWGYRRASRF